MRTEKVYGDFLYVWQLSCAKIQVINLKQIKQDSDIMYMYEGWNFNSGNYLFTTDTK